MSTYSLSNLLKSHIIEFFQRLLVSTETSFPEKVENFVFVKTIKKIGVRKSYKIALYQDKKGNKAIAKLTSSKIKGYHYFSLKNEASLYKILHDVLMRVKRNLPQHLKTYYVPNLVGQYEDNSNYMVLIEFVEGKQSEKWSDKKKYELYFNMSEFISFLGEHATRQERKQIAQRKPIHYIILYPLLVAKSIITYPTEALTILSAIPTFILGIPALLGNKTFSLIHRDLHFMNILVGKNTSLIDLQQCVIGDPMQESITLLRYEWGFQTFYPLLLSGIIKKFGSRKNFVKQFQALSVHSATHGLSGSRFNKKIIKGWSEFIKFAKHPNFADYGGIN